MASAELCLPQSLSPDSRAELLDGAEHRTLPPGEILFRAGDPARALYILERGTVTIEMEVPRGGPRALTTVTAGEVFGWSAILEPHVETATARAAEGCEVAVIEAQALLRDLESNPRLGVDLYRALARVIAARLTAMRQQLMETLVPA